MEKNYLIQVKLIKLMWQEFLVVILLGKYIRIIDYKSSVKDLDLNKRIVLQLQLLTILMQFVIMKLLIRLCKLR